VTPVLFGTGKARFSYDEFDIIRRSGGSTSIKMNNSVCTIDFSTGESTEALDTSNIQDTIDEFWEMRGDYTGQNKITFNNGIDIYLTRENYPELKYKYFTDKTA
jgi:hypothetical protein